MRRLPDTELELMMIIWAADKPVTRGELAEQMHLNSTVAPSTILALLSRLQIRNFITVEKKEGINYYSALVSHEFYIKETGRNIIDYMFENSISNYIAALYRGKKMDDDDLKELKKYIDNAATRLKIN